MNRALIIVLGALAITGCRTLQERVDTLSHPETPIRELCETGRYHDAMRALPRAMQRWAECTIRTGETAEGAAGYEYSTTMFAIAERGDADWGKILDDPDIPYKYKVKMIFEIAEARLGKGSVMTKPDWPFIVIPKAEIDSNFSLHNAIQWDDSQAPAETSASKIDNAPERFAPADR